MEVWLEGMALPEQSRKQTYRVQIPIIIMELGPKSHKRYGLYELQLLNNEGSRPSAKAALSLPTSSGMPLQHAGLQSPAVLRSGYLEAVNFKLSSLHSQGWAEVSPAPCQNVSAPALAKAQLLPGGKCEAFLQLSTVPNDLSTYIVHA